MSCFRVILSIEGNEYSLDKIEHYTKHNIRADELSMYKAVQRNKQTNKRCPSHDVRIRTIHGIIDATPPEKIRHKLRSQSVGLRVDR